MTVHSTVFHDEELLRATRHHGTPLYVYSKKYIHECATKLVNLKLPYGFVPRYAAKANMNPEIVKIIDTSGMHFDASSSYEATELLHMGIDGAKISLSSQQPAHNLTELLGAGVQYVATSIRQLQLFIDAAAVHTTVALRVNPGIGNGHSNRLTTGGVNASFGVWHEYIPDVLSLAADNGIVIDRLHIHIGSGGSPEVWKDVMQTALEVVRKMPQVTTLDIGGGYKVHRYGDDKEADMEKISAVFSDLLIEFAKETGRELQLEIEPGTWVMAHAGVLLTSVADIVDTGNAGHTFLRVDTGMNDFLRPSLYGAQHEIRILNASDIQNEYVITGHNCETSDVLTTAPNDPEKMQPRLLPSASIGDIIAVYDTGAYCASMSAKGYNSFPSAIEIVIE